MLELLALLAIPVILIPCFLIYAWKRNYQGVLRVSTEVVAYDKLQFASILDYDRYSMIIKGKRTLIISGEFHYWRVPDRDRWNEILTTYKSAGLNTIRIYFHWGYHSSRQGSYDFTGNRDIAYLLNICKELGLFVMVAPGPYICAGKIFSLQFLLRNTRRRIPRLVASETRCSDEAWLELILEEMGPGVRRILPRMVQCDLAAVCKASDYT